MLKPTITRLRARRPFDRGLVLFLITALGMTGAGRADVVTDSQSTTLTFVTPSQSVSLKKFDATLGTLTGVAFELDATVSGTVQVHNPAIFLQFLHSETLSDVLKATGTSVSLSDTPQSTVDVNTFITAGALFNVTVPTGPVAQATSTLSPSMFAPYVGTAGDTALFSLVAAPPLGSNLDGFPSTVLALTSSFHEFGPFSAARGVAGARAARGRAGSP
jgi:hypothetical protein